MLGRFVLTPLGEGLRDFAGSLVGPGGFYACLMEQGLIPKYSTTINRRTGQQIRCKERQNQAIASLQVQTTSIAQNLDAQGQGQGQGSSANSGQNQQNREGQGGENQAGQDQKASKASKRSGSKSSKRRFGTRTSNPSSSLLSLNKGYEKKKKRFGTRTSNPSSLSPDLYTDGKKKKKRKKKKASNDDRGIGFLGYIHFKQERPERAPARFRLTSSAKDTNNLKETKPSVVALTAPSRSDQKPPETDTSLTLPDLLKYFILAAIFILLAAVIFSQIMEFQNRD